MKLLKVGAASLNQTPLAWDENRQNIEHAITLAKQEGIALLCLPELCLSGYGCEDMFLSSALLQTVAEVLEEILPCTKGIAVAIGLPLFFDTGLYDCACLIVDGKIQGFVAKQFLAREGIHYEPRWFRPWPAGKRTECTFASKTYPLGDLCFDFDGIRVGFEICEDAWAAERPGGRLAKSAVDIILNPSASHFAFGKYEVRKRFVLEGARAFGVGYLFANLIGNEAGRAIYDGCCLIASGSKLAAVGKRFHYSNVALTSAVLDIDSIRMERSKSASNELPEGQKTTSLIAVPYSLPKAAPGTSQLVEASWEKSSRLKDEEFARAIMLGLFDYARKSKSEGFVVSLSGGVDSATVACLVGLMLASALKELSLDGFKQKFSFVKDLSKASSEKDLVQRLLTCVYQATENSSETTHTAAKTVSEALGARFVDLEVGAIAKAYVGQVSKALGRELRWETDDISLQNIQARVRGPGVWLIANVQRALLLATSNRSEAAVGYTTMDGDTCGGLSPIAGIDKAYLRSWLRNMETLGLEGIPAIPVLSKVNSQEPTAELRPASQAQTDEKDLMPYEVLDVIERYAIRDKQSPAEVYQMTKASFTQYADKDLQLWVQRFFRLWCRNQWKRERYAPCFHLDDENLDPKTWCRFPILSGGFERELKILRQSHFPQK